MISPDVLARVCTTLAGESARGPYEPPSIYSVMECIKRANRPKLQITGLSKDYPVLAYIFGRFDEIVVDNGKEFSGNALEDAMADVGTTIRFAPIASPTYKAIVERFFGTLNQLLNTKLPGAVFKTDLLREMGYDPSKDAILTIEQLEELIHEALATYHVSLHSGVGAPPAQLWQEDMHAHGIDVIDDDRVLDKTMGAVKHPCRVTTSGVTLLGLQYHDERKVGELLEDLIGFECAARQSIVGLPIIHLGHVRLTEVVGLQMAQREMAQFVRREEVHDEIAYCDRPSLRLDRRLCIQVDQKLHGLAPRALHVRSIVLGILAEPDKLL
jgi:hypothetical protein